MKNMIIIIFIGTLMMSCSLKNGSMHSYKNQSHSFNPENSVQIGKLNVWNKTNVSEGYYAVCIQDKLGNYEYLPNRKIKAEIVYEDQSRQEIWLEGNNFWTPNYEEMPEQAHLYTKRIRKDVEKKPAMIKVWLPGSEEKQNIEFNIS